jgi:hypothetical protein
MISITETTYVILVHNDNDETDARASVRHWTDK